MIYICIIFIIILILLLTIYVIKLHNKLAKLEINIKKEYSNIDVSLKKRSDLITKLVDTVKSYMKHEKDVLTDLIELRNKCFDLKEESKLLDIDLKISHLLNKILVLAENYPDLQSSNNFMHLQNELQTMEEDIAQTRILYNKTINIYNNICTTYPNKIFASLLGYKKYEYYPILTEEKEMPEIKL